MAGARQSENIKISNFSAHYSFDDIPSVNVLQAWTIWSISQYVSKAALSQSLSESRCHCQEECYSAVYWSPWGVHYPLHNYTHTRQTNCILHFGHVFWNRLTDLLNNSVNWGFSSGQAWCGQAFYANNSDLVITRVTLVSLSRIGW